MSARRQALIGAALLALGGVPLAPSASASPPVDPGALAHCASMTIADERLACYDSLSRPKSSVAVNPWLAKKPENHWGSEFVVVT